MAVVWEWYTSSDSEPTHYTCTCFFFYYQYSPAFTGSKCHIPQKEKFLIRDEILQVEIII